MTAADPTLALVGAVLIASLTGSVHCVGMCGPLALVACSSEKLSCSSSGRSSKNAAGAAMSYQCARGVSYIVLGAIAGALGSIADLGASLVGVQQVASIVAGATLASIGLVMLLRLYGARIGIPHLPAWLAEPAKRWHLIAMKFPPNARAAALGFVTPLLPCGWLWAFVVVAAGSASIGAGAAVMAAFWLGSVPALTAVVLGARLAAGSLGRFVQGAMAVLLIAVGVDVASHRASIAPGVMHALTQQTHRVEDLADETPACCAKSDETSDETSASSAFTVEGTTP